MLRLEIALSRESSESFMRSFEIEVKGAVGVEKRSIFSVLYRAALLLWQLRS